jgi:pimeloyl-ACP methyl ester carboxylesterase
MISPFVSAHQPRLMSFEGFQYAFANTLSQDAARAVYDRYAVPESRMVPRQSLTSIARIDFSAEHAPLLFIAGGSDHIIPATLNRSNHDRYRAARSVTSFREFAGRDHVTIVEPGWEQVADFVLEWLDGPGSASGAA